MDQNLIDELITRINTLESENSKLKQDIENKKKTKEENKHLFSLFNKGPKAFEESKI
jgi:hypothetical protein